LPSTGSAPVSIHPHDSPARGKNHTPAGTDARTRDDWPRRHYRLRSLEGFRRCEVSKRAAFRALGRRNTPVVLSVTLTRLYTLRNQLVHGGAAWNSSVNRTQLRDCTNLLGQLVPVIICIMMDNPDTLWGDPVYPVVEM